MRILGIDPGIGRMGWGIVEEHGSKLLVLKYGCLETTPKSDVGERLERIYAFTKQLIEDSKLDALAIEELFFNTNTTTAFAVGQARGVVILAAAQQNIPLTTYTPLQVKMAITGYGRAEKGQIGQMVKTLLHLEKIPKPDDTTDALAIALTHAFSYRLQQLR